MFKLTLMLTKSLKVTVLLGFLLAGVGHIYLGFITRGIIILIIGIAFGYVVSSFVPFPLSWLLIGPYWIWQLVDVYNLYKKMTFEKT
jgi:TM2 domain-containing membrane protein YozV